jgi:prolyl 4-hydroxylase
LKKKNDFVIFLPNLYFLLYVLLLFFSVPDHSRALNNKEYFVKMLADSENEKEKMGDDGSTDLQQDQPIKNVQQVDDYKSSDEFVMYERLCRGENTHVR